MGCQKRTQIKAKKDLKRKRRRDKLAKSGRNPDDYFYSGVYVSGKLK